MQIKSLSLTKLKMGKQKDLTEEEKSTIVRCLDEGRKSTEIAKELCREHRSVKRIIADANQTRKRCDKGVKRKMSRRQIYAIKREAVKQSLLTSKQIFEQTGARCQWNRQNYAFPDPQHSCQACETEY